MSFESDLIGVLSKIPQVNMNVIMPLINSAQIEGPSIDSAVQAVLTHGIAVNPTITGTRPNTGVAFGSSTNTTAGVEGAQQVETISVATGATAAGTLVFRVTSALLAGGYKDINVAVAISSAEAVALNIRDELGDDEDISTHFTIGGTGANIILTAKEKAANDATLAMSLEDADNSGVTVGVSANTTAGVAPVTQVETIAVTTGCSVSETLSFKVTSALLDGGEKTIELEVAEGDTVNQVATKIRAALALDEDIGAAYTIGGTNANIVLTANAAAANDATLAMAIVTGVSATDAVLVFTGTDGTVVSANISQVQIVLLKPDTYAITTDQATLSVEELVVIQPVVLTITIAF